MEVCPEPIHLVDECDTGYTIGICLSPDSLRLWFHSADCAYNHDRSVKDTKRALHLCGEVYVSGSIDNIDLVFFPVTGGGSTCDGDTTILLLFEEVHGCFPVVYFTDAMVFTCIIEDAFSGSGLARINMCHNSNISCCLLVHVLFPSNNLSNITIHVFYNQRERRIRRMRRALKTAMMVTPVSANTASAMDA